MEERESLVGRRLYALLLDMLCLFMVSFIAFVFVVRIYNNTANFMDVINSYKNNIEAYNLSKDPLLYDEIVAQQSLILMTGLKILLISVSIASIIIFIIMPLCITKGRTLGKVGAKLYVVDQNNNYVKFYIFIIRQILYIVINVILGICTLGIVPLINLLCCILRSDERAIYDMILKLNVVDGRLPVELTNIL